MIQLSMLPPSLLRTSMIKPLPGEDGIELARELAEVVAAHRPQVDVADLLLAQIVHHLAGGCIPTRDSADRPPPSRRWG